MKSNAWDLAKLLHRDPSIATGVTSVIAQLCHNPDDLDGRDTGLG